MVRLGYRTLAKVGSGWWVSGRFGRVFRVEVRGLR